MRTKIKVAVAAAVGVAALGGQAGIADAAGHAAKKKHRVVRHQSNSSTSASDPGSTNVSASGTGRCDGHGGGPANEPALTGDTKTSAENAALAAVPGGTVWRSSKEDPSDPSGAAYEVHVTKSDGSEVEVLEDASFKVLSVNASPQGPHGGPQNAQGGN